MPSSPEPTPPPPLAIVESETRKNVRPLSALSDESGIQGVILIGADRNPERCIVVNS